MRRSSARSMASRGAMCRRASGRSTVRLETTRVFLLPHRDAGQDSKAAGREEAGRAAAVLNLILIGSAVAGPKQRPAWRNADRCLSRVARPRWLARVRGQVRECLVQGGEVTDDALDAGDREELEHVRAGDHQPQLTACGQCPL